MSHATPQKCESRRLVVLLRVEWPLKLLADKIITHEERIDAGHITADERVTKFAAYQFQPLQGCAENIISGPLSVCSVLDFKINCRTEIRVQSRRSVDRRSEEHT